tara:strand:+ start:314 stop:661 length:348 start_codon:yes stop_codon:yes gene_type:complete
MSLIFCPECKKEISDSALNCIHCGYPLNSQVNEKPQNNETIIINEQGFLENLVYKIIDFVFAVIYLTFIYGLITTDYVELEYFASWIGVFLVFLSTYLIQKVCKAVFGTIARIFT